MIQRYRILPCLVALLVIGACDSNTGPATEFIPSIDLENCDLSQDFLLSLLDFDAIQSLDDPNWTEPGSAFTAYLQPQDRVIGLVINGQPYAVPHNILWHHEIVNFETDLGPIAITYCPLTGSSIVFSRSGVSGREFGVSGFLYKNNLVMYDRTDRHSLWVQMGEGAACGPEKGSSLSRFPAIEMQWEDWLELNPSTLVMSQNQGLAVSRDYSEDGYPYADYESYSYDEFLYPARMPALDRTRPVKERVLGIPRNGTVAPKAFPFDALTALDGSRQVVSFDHAGDAVLLWSDEAIGGMVYRPITSAGNSVELVATEDGFVDSLTGSTFTLDGVARSGPHQGQTLRVLETAYVAFWGAWAAFNEGTGLWQQPELEAGVS